MEEVWHETAVSWLDAANKDHDLSIGDDPRRRVLGFYDHTDEVHHILPLTAVKMSYKDLGDQKDLLLTPQGREQLLGTK